MPYSSDEGKKWIAAHIAHDHAGSVLDIGAGAGAYADLLRPAASNRPMTAIEIHAPYVERFHLDGKYERVIVGDAREVELPSADVVILGDVLEHMPFADAVELWRRARLAATVAVYLSLPIVEWPQGECEGNPHEAHLETWPHGRVKAQLQGIYMWSLEPLDAPVIGVYKAQPGALTAPTRTQLVALEEGDAISHEGMMVRRPAFDPLARAADGMLHFVKGYLEGDLQWFADRMLIEDAIADPWELAAWELDLSAARRRWHRRGDGSLVEVSR